MTTPRCTGLSSTTLHSLVNVMYDEVLIYDGNYTIVYINQACCRHYCCTPDEMIGKSFFDFIHIGWWYPSILPVVYKEKKAYAITQKTYTGKELLTIAVPIFDEHANIIYVVMNVRDTVHEKDLYQPPMLEEAVLHSGSDPVVESEEMRQVLAMVRRMSALDVTCIFSGESGTGKTMLAKYMHSMGPRKDKPFMALNCAAIPAELLESELFGYVRGAFTGANPKGKKGVLEEAHGGTLFLDEIAELAPSAQAKLLHFLQEREFMPLGSARSVQVDVRIIAATNKNLASMAANGQFREDLFYRLNVVDIHIPPLRQRKKDIVSLIHQFVNEFSAKYGVTRQFTQEAVRVLTDFDWPGNVRELRHVVERMVVTTEGLMVDVPQLPRQVFGIADSRLPLPLLPEGSHKDRMEAYEAHIVQETYKAHPTSRGLAAKLHISQTKANKLIQKYIQGKSQVS